MESHNFTADKSGYGTEESLTITIGHNSYDGAQIISVSDRGSLHIQNDNELQAIQAGIQSYFNKKNIDSIAEKHAISDPNEGIDLEKMVDRIIELKDQGFDKQLIMIEILANL